MSFSEYPQAPDIETATMDYRERFSGDVGKWFLEIQSDCTRKILSERSELTGGSLNVLDVGGGHGQNVAPILGEGHKLTIVGSNEECGNLVRDVDSPDFSFVTGSMLDLPFDDARFDLVLSYRMMAHIGDWRRFAKELARVSKGGVAVDYPTSRSVNALSSTFYASKKRIEMNTREFRRFSEPLLRREMQAAGLYLRRRYPQFLFPMAMHRAMGNKGLSATLERLPRLLQLTRLFGSPVIAAFEKSEGRERSGQ